MTCKSVQSRLAEGGLLVVPFGVQLWHSQVCPPCLSESSREPSPARFLPESTSHHSEVLLTRLTLGCFSRPRRRPASAPWSLLWVPPGAGMLGPRRQDTEVLPGNGDLQWGLCILDASSGNTSASLQDWLCQLRPMSLSGVPASAAGSVLRQSFTCRQL